MSISKLYSNRPDKYKQVEFVDGLNVVMAEIRLPENKNIDTHNLGKTTLGRMLDFGFLAQRESKFFLFKDDTFESFVFFLEIQLEDGSYITVRRGVKEASKISFKKHTARHQDFSELPQSGWDHFEMPFEKAREMLDSWLDWRGLNPWHFRSGLGYFLRSQDDFGDVFRLGRFASSHAEWKPLLAHLLGFDDELVTSHYEKESEIEKKELAAQTLAQEIGGSFHEVSRIDGILLLKRQEAEKKQKLVDGFDFRTQDKAVTKNVLVEMDERIASLNSRRYSLLQNRKKVAGSIEEDQILFNPDEAKKLFGEVGILFDGQIKKDFEQLISFNKAITEERRRYLAGELTEIDAEIKAINSELNVLGKKRSEAMAFLSATDVFEKYKRTCDEIVILKAEIISLERQKEIVKRLQELRREVRSLTDEKDRVKDEIEADVEKQRVNGDSLFSTICIFFSEIVEQVIDRKALLTVTPNLKGHLDFKAEILDEAGNASSAAGGFTYKKLLCVAFDLAVLRAHLGEAFPRFVYHDGIFESLDDRKKENLTAVVREYAGFGIQPIITLIDSDLPDRLPGIPPLFASDEVVLTLHDQGESGRLFMMHSW